MLPIRQTAARLCMAAEIGCLKYRIFTFMRWSTSHIRYSSKRLHKGCCIGGTALTRGVYRDVNKHCMRAQHACSQDTDVLQTDT